MDERNDDQERKPGDKFYESAKTDDNGNIFHYTVTQKAKNISTAMFITLKGFAGTRTEYNAYLVHAILQKQQMVTRVETRR